MNAGRVRCGGCSVVLHDPRPRSLSGAERAALAAFDARPQGAPYTTAELDALLDHRVNGYRPSAEPWTPEAAKALGLPSHVHGVWTLRGEVGVLVLKCRRCGHRYALTEAELTRRQAEATRRGEDVHLTGRDRA
ncbi:MAG TPA: hypothetical protein PKE40_12555 [Arachnia sp.]|nr:hypothetical protein [Arachnia sp.]HMT87174.1 hypothetical protein [Arachnia sp.]